MKVEILQSGNNAGFELCEGVQKNQHLEGFDIEMHENVQEQAYFRRLAIRTFGRGNTRTAISFAITREHADAFAAEEYNLTHHGDIPKRGEVVFTCESDTGAAARWVLSDARIRTSRGRVIGCATIHTYQLVGGDFERETI